MHTIFAIPTLAGSIALTASMGEGGVPLVLSQMVLGDGNGNEVTPLETQTGLVNQRAIVPITAKTQVGKVLTVDALIDETIGGFTIREAGLLDENGVLMFVASVPNTEKRLPTENTQQIITLGMILTISPTAQVTINVTGTTYATHDYVQEQINALRTNITHPLRVYNIAVRSLTLAAPPSTPTPGDVWLVAADATGAWAGRSGQLAQWINTTIGWVFASPPVAHIISDQATGLQYQRGTDGVYRVIIPANTDTARRWLHDEVVGGARVRGWSNPRNPSDLATAALIPSHQITVWNPATQVAEKFSLESLIAATLTDRLHARMYFMGGF